MGDRFTLKAGNELHDVTSHNSTFTVTKVITKPDLSYYTLTPWSRVLPENLTGSQLVKKFSAFYGIQRFIIAFTSASHLSLSRANLIQSIHHIPLLEDPS
jgi:hypothetical protein